MMIYLMKRVPIISTIQWTRIFPSIVLGCEIVFLFLISIGYNFPVWVKNQFANSLGQVWKLTRRWSGGRGRTIPNNRCIIAFQKNVTLDFCQ